MGGINCGCSNNRVIKITEYRLAYAEYTKALFQGLELFSKANSSVEDFTILELEDTPKALLAFRNALDSLDQSKTAFCRAIDFLDKCLAEIRPLFRYDKIKNGSIEQYQITDTDSNYIQWSENGLVTVGKSVWDDVVQSLVTGGEVKYLEYQIGQVEDLIQIISNLMLEYKAIEPDVRLGVSFVKIRDIEVDVTPYTAQALTKINDIFSSLTALCLLEYTSHTSISGKTIDASDMIPLSVQDEIEVAN